MVSYCSLHCRIKGAEKTGPVLLGQRSGSAGIRSQLPQVPGYFATGKRVSYIRLRPLLVGRGDDARPFLRQRDASGISEVTHTSTAEMWSVIQPSAASALSPTRTMLTFEMLAAGSVARRWRQ
jgi:hypothetical protein